MLLAPISLHHLAVAAGSQCTETLNMAAWALMQLRADQLSSFNIYWSVSQLKASRQAEHSVWDDCHLSRFEITKACKSEVVHGLKEKQL